jgi:multidrug efflux pump subunit AcrB
VARVELGAENLTVRSLLGGKPGAGMGVVLADGANAVEVADAVKAKIAELEPLFPNQLKTYVSYDTTPFVSASIDEVVKALVEAMILVVLVIYIFLQNFRATLIPAIAVPVVLLGTFGVLSVFGYSINTLTMFGMVLAIGLLVDDAIVVVENVERVMSEEGLSPKEATRKSMAEITPALVGIALVLSAVFIPMAFFGGSTGVIYRQFSITIVSAMVLSVLVALTLTPALCATLLQAAAQGRAPRPRAPRPGSRAGRPLLRRLQPALRPDADRYQASSAASIRRGKRSLLVYALICVAMAVMFLRLPTSFLPDEDQGFAVGAGHAAARLVERAPAAHPPPGAGLLPQAARRRQHQYDHRPERRPEFGARLREAHGVGRTPGKEQSADAIARKAPATSRKYATRVSSCRCRPRCAGWAPTPASTST